MRLLILIILAFMILVCLFPPKTSKGDVVVEQASFGEIDFNGPFPTFQFQKFDAGLGTLEAVTVEASGLIQNTFVLDHSSMTTLESLTLPGFFLIAPASFTTIVDGSRTFTGAGVVMANPLDWIGPGSVSYQVLGSAFSYADFSDGNGKSVVTSRASAEAKVTFVYEAVPEPSEWILCAIVVAFFGVTAARFRKAF